MKLKKFNDINEEFIFGKKNDDESLNSIIKKVKDNTDNYDIIDHENFITLTPKDKDSGSEEIKVYTKSPDGFKKGELVHLFLSHAGGGGVLNVTPSKAQEFIKYLRFLLRERSFKVEDEKKEIKIDPGYGLDRFYSAINKLDDKNQKSRKHQLSNTFFRDFIGKDLINSTIKDIIVDVRIDDDYYGINIILQNGSKVSYYFTKDPKRDGITIQPHISSASDLSREEKERFKEDLKKVSRKDARIIGKITKKFNPSTTYFNGTGDLIIKEYESKRNIVSFDKFLNEELNKETYLSAAEELERIGHYKRSKKLKSHALGNKTIKTEHQEYPLDSMDTEITFVDYFDDMQSQNEKENILHINIFRNKDGDEEIHQDAFDILYFNEEDYPDDKGIIEAGDYYPLDRKSAKILYDFIISESKEELNKLTDSEQKRILQSFISDLKVNHLYNK